MSTQPINSKIPDTDFQSGDIVKCIARNSSEYKNEFVIVGFIVEDNENYAMLGELNLRYTKEEILNNLISDYEIKISSLNKYFTKVEG